MQRLTESSNGRRGRHIAGILTVLLVAVALMATALPSSAVEYIDGKPFDRHKFGVQIGGGYARISTAEDSGVFGDTSSTPDDFTVGMSFGFDYGYRSTPELSLEGFVTSWTGTLSGELGNETWAVSVIGGGLRWRPMGQGFYVRGGFGAALVIASLDDPQSEEAKSEYTDYGFGVVGSVGYDFAIAGDFAAGPRLEIVGLDVGDGVTSTAMNMLFSFTW